MVTILQQLRSERYPDTAVVVIAELNVFPRLFSHFEHRELLVNLPGRTIAFVCTALLYPGRSSTVMRRSVFRVPGIMLFFVFVCLLRALYCFRLRSGRARSCYPPR